MSSSISDELLEASFLVTMDVLFVILNSIALHKLFLICDTKFKLV